MSLEKVYQPKETEKNIYDLWQKTGVFQPTSSKNLFSIILPPPNANADLHVGTSLDMVLKDVIGRYWRLQGRPVLLLPGADHAGFETWVVYERYLQSQGKSRFDFSPKELYDQVWDFVDKNKSKMIDQIRQLGVSCDWSRFKFTLDSDIVEQTQMTFKKMWRQGLIYREKRLVNYCLYHGTSFADREVEHRLVEGKMYYIKYPTVDGQHIMVGTTRPETMLGDTAVAVHPKDERFKSLRGKEVALPLVDRIIPVITSSWVDRQLGTGAVKITPGSDFLDAKIGQEAKLESLDIVDQEGKLKQVPKKYHGLSINQARKVVVEDLKAAGLLVEIKPHQHSVGHCYKCLKVLEPLRRDQWFVKMQPLAKAAIAQLKAGKIRFYPESKQSELIAYLEGLQDWNISRQIAWGIPIPVFRQKGTNNWRFDQRVDQDEIVIDGQVYERDPDVFDTWWSSGQWAFATLKDEPEFYPTSLMETGVDILRPWVSKMIMLSLFMTKKMPFKEVFLHGMVVDEKGAKMSKSKGNVINPTKVVQEYGADALRLALIRGLSPGQPQPFSLNKVIASRNFCNKLWNIARYIKATPDHQNDLGPADCWIRDRLNQTSQTCQKAMDEYRLDLAYEALYDFVWGDLADWYLEASKIKPNGAFMRQILKDTLIILHPWLPFVTETIYQALFAKDQCLAASRWPDKEPVDPKLVAEFNDLQATVKEIRHLLLRPDLAAQATIFIQSNKWQETIKKLSGAKQVLVSDKPNGLELKSPYPAWVLIEAKLLKEPLRRIETDIEALIQKQNKLKTRLDNQAYLDKAPKNLVAASQQELKNNQSEIQVLQKAKESLSLLVETE